LEWSGELLYKVEGEATKETFTPMHIIPLDLGDKAYTTFKDSGVLAELIADNEEYFDYKRGMIHSHNTMQTNFSNTDITQLDDGAKESDFFLSVIVNNANNVTAKVARKTITGFYTKVVESWNNGRKVTTMIDVPEKEEIFVQDIEVRFHYTELPEWFTQKANALKQKPKPIVKPFTAFDYGNRGFSNGHTKGYNGYQPKEVIKHNSLSSIYLDVDEEHILDFFKLTNTKQLKDKLTEATAQTVLEFVDFYEKRLESDKKDNIADQDQTLIEGLEDVLGYLMLDYTNTPFYKELQKFIFELEQLEKNDINVEI